jgi:hypothetical protein
MESIMSRQIVTVLATAGIALLSAAALSLALVV